MAPHDDMKCQDDDDSKGSLDSRKRTRFDDGSDGACSPHSARRRRIQPIRASRRYAKDPKGTYGIGLMNILSWKRQSDLSGRNLEFFDSQSVGSTYTTEHVLRDVCATTPSPKKRHSNSDFHYTPTTVGTQNSRSTVDKRMQRVRTGAVADDHEGGALNCLYSEHYIRSKSLSQPLAPPSPPTAVFSSKARLVPTAEADDDADVEPLEGELFLPETFTHDELPLDDMSSPTVSTRASAWTGIPGDEDAINESFESSQSAGSDTLSTVHSMKRDCVSSNRIHFHNVPSASKHVAFGLGTCGYDGSFVSSPVSTVDSGHRSPLTLSAMLNSAIFPPFLDGDKNPTNLVSPLSSPSPTSMLRKHSTLSTASASLSRCSTPSIESTSEMHSSPWQGSYNLSPISFDDPSHYKHDMTGSYPKYFQQRKAAFRPPIWNPGKVAPNRNLIALVDNVKAFFKTMSFPSLPRPRLFRYLFAINLIAMTSLAILSNILGMALWDGTEANYSEGLPQHRLAFENEFNDGVGGMAALVWIPDDPLPDEEIFAVNIAHNAPMSSRLASPPRRLDLVEHSINSVSACSRVQSISISGGSDGIAPDDASAGEAVLLLDDDVVPSCEEIDRAFRVWKENPNRVVGFFGWSYGMFEVDTGGDAASSNWLKSFWSGEQLDDDWEEDEDGRWEWAVRTIPTEDGRGYSIVSDRAAFVHRKFLEQLKTFQYSSLDNEWRSHCQDMELSLFVTAITGRPPIVVPADPLELRQSSSSFPSWRDDRNPDAESGGSRVRCLERMMEELNMKQLPVEERMYMGRMQ